MNQLDCVRSVELANATLAQPLHSTHDALKNYWLIVDTQNWRLLSLLNPAHRHMKLRGATAFILAYDIHRIPTYNFFFNRHKIAIFPLVYSTAAVRVFLHPAWNFVHLFGCEKRDIFVMFALCLVLASTLFSIRRYCWLVERALVHGFLF